MQGWRMPDLPLRLVEKLQTKVRAKLQRTQRQVQLRRPVVNLSDRCTLGRAKTSDRDLDAFQRNDCRRSRKPLIGEQSLAGLVQMHSMPFQLGQQLRFAQPTDANGSGHPVMSGSWLSLSHVEIRDRGRLPRWRGAVRAAPTNVAGHAFDLTARACAFHPRPLQSCPEADRSLSASPPSQPLAAAARRVPRATAPQPPPAARARLQANLRVGQSAVAIRSFLIRQTFWAFAIAAPPSPHCGFATAGLVPAGRSLTSYKRKNVLRSVATNRLLQAARLLRSLYRAALLVMRPATRIWSRAIHPRPPLIPCCRQPISCQSLTVFV